jgi:hypothetical protein
LDGFLNPSRRKWHSKNLTLEEDFKDRCFMVIGLVQIAEKGLPNYHLNLQLGDQFIVKSAGQKEEVRRLSK